MNVTDVTIDSCTVHAHGAYGIEMRGVDSTISSCEVFDTGCVAISAVCGAMRTLTPGGCVVTNNTITRMGQTKRTYQPGLRWAGVENNFTFNRVFNGPHACVSGGGATNAFSRQFHIKTIVWPRQARDGTNIKQTQKREASFAGNDAETDVGAVGNIFEYNTLEDCAFETSDVGAL